LRVFGRRIRVFATARSVLAESGERARGHLSFAVKTAVDGREFLDRTYLHTYIE